MAEELPTTFDPPEEELGTLPIPAADIYAVLEANQGNISATAKHFGKSRSWLKARIDRSKDLQMLVDDFSETLVDMAESNIFRDVAAGDGAMSRFVASTKGKGRGWGTTGVNKEGNIIVEVRSFATEPDKDGS